MNLYGRSIPACTGKPNGKVSSIVLLGVYPRVYGETRTAFCESPLQKGLSPRVRGNPRSKRSRYTARRSIPACTGKPHVKLVIIFSPEVYPRVYGETENIPLRSVFSPGLSPRVRGNRFLSQEQDEVSRSIPACTGKPADVGCIGVTSWVYPRVYGETLSWRYIKPHIEGLSPRVRGNQCHLETILRSRRSIPACTGKPVSSCPECTSPKVYPRVYGETGVRSGTAISMPGLSPRVRGNLLLFLL